MLSRHKGDYSVKESDYFPFVCISNLMLNGKLHSENKSKKDNFKAPESNKEVLLESHDWKWETC